MPKRGRRPDYYATLEMLMTRLRNDTTWQGYFSASEQRVMLRMARGYWKLQITAGFKADEMYTRVIRMLYAAAPVKMPEVMCTANPEAVHCVWMRR